MLRPAPLNKKWTVEEKESLLDYLHGHVEDDEVKACCYYEYARASEALRKARQTYDLADPENSSLKVSSYLPRWTCRWFCFWQCLDYPVLPWRKLSRGQQEQFVIDFRKSPATPLIRDFLVLMRAGVLDALAQQARDELNEFNQRARNPHDFIFAREARPAIVNGSLPFIKHVVITVDYRDGVEAVTKQFAHWLHSETNQKLFKDSYKKPIPHTHNTDSPDLYKERLKYLAAWRLYDQMGIEEAKKWTAKNRRRLKPELLSNAPFFREKPRQTTNGKHFVGPLYNDQRQWEASRKQAQGFLELGIEGGGMG